MIDDAGIYISQVEEAANYIKGKLDGLEPKICIVLGSGLAPLAKKCEIKISIDYKEIPNFPVSTVPGHEGRLIVGLLSGKLVYLMSGRFHYYEGYDNSISTFYVRVMSSLNVETLFLTNAAGGIMPGMKPSDLMIIEDHISLFCESPLRGKNLEKFGPRFPDQSVIYDKDYVYLLQKCAFDCGIKIHKGIYCYTKGPQYESPAEIRAIRTLGGDAVGMSTVPEAIVASHCGMKVAAVSCISNLAAGISPNPLSHKEVMENAEKSSDNSCNLVMSFIEKLS